MSSYGIHQLDGSSWLTGIPPREETDAGIPDGDDEPPPTDTNGNVQSGCGCDLNHFSILALIA